MQHLKSQISLPAHSRHRIVFADARGGADLKNNSADLVVTSPPYPMIEMWDAAFAGLNPAIGRALKTHNGARAFDLMHAELDAVWRQCHRILRPGGVACINVGDAVRTIAGSFQIYPNHARIITGMVDAGFTPLPDILWRKQTNAPNKFIGSGMLPPSAYVTLEHEYILVFRKGNARKFARAADKEARRAGAYFWEERNAWFSDVWMDLKGSRQNMGDRAVRARSGAFPFELAFRLVCMFSLYGDTVHDPVLGTGTTTAAAIAACRNSVGIEIDESMAAAINDTLAYAVDAGHARVQERFEAHKAFVAARQAAGHVVKYVNPTLGMPVMTSQETGLQLFAPHKMTHKADNDWAAECCAIPPIPS